MKETYEQLILKHYSPKDVRTWFYFPIYMPLDKNGNGPETRPERVRKETWEVWDACCETYSSFDNLYDAINLAMKLNQKLLEGETVEQIYSDTKAGH